LVSFDLINLAYGAKDLFYDLFYDYSIHLLSTAGHLTKSYDGTDDFMLLFPRPWSHSASSSPSQPSLRRSRDEYESLTEYEFKDGRIDENGGYF
jgi:hypothetical protein